MTSSVDNPASTSASQRLLGGLLRGTLRLLFRGLIRPPMPIAGQRLVLRALAAATLTPRGVRRQRGTLGGVPCEWSRVPQGGGQVLLYLHGGAYVIGSPATHRSITANLARRCGADVCALDYRLAPEHPYPAALEDALAAYAALLEQGTPASRIVFAGDSAGGHLALIAALALKARGLPLPAALVLFSPLTDAGGSERHAPAAGDPLLSPAWIEQAARAFFPPHIPREAPELSPLNADLSGLPPLLIQVGEDEILRNDSLRLAERARAAGVSVRLQRYLGCWHVFQAHAGVLAVADRALDEVARFVAPGANSILITGAASGIGAATARLFHARGWRVGLLDRDGAALAALAGELEDAWHAELDVLDRPAVNAALDAFAEACGGHLRMLFNCAGILRFGAFAEITAEEHGRIVAINVEGLINCCHAAFPHLRRTPGAQVLNMGSASGLYGVPQMASYSASKFAVRGLTEALELEWRPHGIRVADLMPPFVRTPMVTRQTFEPQVLHRLGLRMGPETIAEAAWRHTTCDAVHRPIGGQFKALYWAGQLSPPWMNRLVMRWLSR